MSHYRLSQILRASVAVVALSQPIGAFLTSPTYGAESTGRVQENVSLRSMFQKLIDNLDAKDVESLSVVKRGYLYGPVGSVLPYAYLTSDLDVTDNSNSTAQKNGLIKLAQNALTNGQGTASGEKIEIGDKAVKIPGTDKFDLKEISPYLLNIAAAAKKWGEGNVLKFNGDNNYNVLLFKYTAPNGKVIDVTIYSMMATILEQADAMKRQGVTNSAFLANYQAIYDALAQDIMMRTEAGRIKQVENYVQNLDPAYTQTALIEAVREGKIDVTWLFEYLQTGLDAKQKMAKR